MASNRFAHQFLFGSSMSLTLRARVAHE
ncbi:uncharacterized protein METZ01_LOCUS354641, partial [marine metagenome]